MVRPARRPAPSRPPESPCESSVRHQSLRQPVVDPDSPQAATGSVCRWPDTRVRGCVYYRARIVQRSVIPEERAHLVDLVAGRVPKKRLKPVSYTHLRAHETRHDLVCRLLLEKKKKK